jgi:hypothetical protein
LGRPGLTKNRKFLRLVRELQPTCKAFSEQVARGVLELMWDMAYENGDDYLGDADDVEASARWTGKRGALCNALVRAGGEGETGFIEELDERPGHFIVHDLFDHAPEYVKKRMAREVERITKGQTISDVRREAAKKRWDANGSKRLPLALQTSANGDTPSPTPTHLAKATDGAEPKTASAQPPLNLPQEPLTPLLAYLAAEFEQAKAMPENEKAWAQAFPGVDLLAEAKKAKRWELDNPRLIKTQKRRFLGNWFARAQNDLRRSDLGRARPPGAAQLQITPEAKADHAVPGRKVL